MTRKHDLVLKAIIESVPAVEGKTFVTSAQYPPPRQGEVVEPPYVVMHPVDGRDEAPRLTGPSITLNPWWTLHSVGVSAEQAKWLGEQVKSRLVVNGFGVVPVVAGELPGRFWWDSPVPVQRDPDVSPALFFHVAECGFSSDLLV